MCRHSHSRPKYTGLCATEHWCLPGKQGPLEGSLENQLAVAARHESAGYDSSSSEHPCLAAVVPAAVPHIQEQVTALLQGERCMVRSAGALSLGIQEAGHRFVARLTPQRQQPALVAVP